MARRSGIWLVSAVCVSSLFFAACGTGDAGDDGDESARTPVVVTSPGGGLTGAGVPDKVDPEIIPLDSSSTSEASGLLGLDVPSGSRVFYVDSGNGDDSASGVSVDEAWQSLSRGIEALEPGVDVFVLDGVYEELQSPNQAHYVIRDLHGSADQWSRLLAFPGHQPTIRATSTSGIEILFSEYVEVSGFHIEGIGFGPENSQGYGIIARDGHHFVFQDNELHGMGNSGIGGGMNSSHFTIANNVIYDNALWSPDGSSGVSLWRLSNVGGADEDGYANRIIGNTIYGNENRVNCTCPPGGVITDGNGIIIDQSNINGYTGRSLVSDNTIFRNGGRAINAFDSAHIDIFNNTTYQNAFTDGLHGERAEIGTFQASDVRIEKNLVVAADGTTAISTSDDITVVNNVFVGGDELGPNPGIEDPQFVSTSSDPGEADFRLRDTSPVHSLDIAPVGAR